MFRKWKLVGVEGLSPEEGNTFWGASLLKRGKKAKNGVSESVCDWGDVTSVTLFPKPLREAPIALTTNLGIAPDSYVDLHTEGDQIWCAFNVLQFEAYRKKVEATFLNEIRMGDTPYKDLSRLKSALLICGLSPLQLYYSWVRLGTKTNPQAFLGSSVQEVGILHCKLSNPWGSECGTCECTAPVDCDGKYRGQKGLFHRG